MARKNRREESFEPLRKYIRGGTPNAPGGWFWYWRNAAYAVAAREHTLRSLRSLRVEEWTPVEREYILDILDNWGSPLDVCTNLAADGQEQAVFQLAADGRLPPKLTKVISKVAPDSAKLLPALLEYGRP